MRFTVIAISVLIVLSWSTVGEILDTLPHRSKITLSSGYSDTTAVRRGILAIVAQYEAEGFLAVSVSIVGAKLDPNEQFFVEVVPGPRYCLGSITFEGLPPSTRKFAARLSGLPPLVALTIEERARINAYSSRLKTWRRDGDVIYHAEPGSNLAQAEIRYQSLAPIGVRLNGGLGFGAVSNFSGQGELIARRVLDFDDLWQVNFSKSESERTVRTSYENWLGVLNAARALGWLSNRERRDHFTSIEGGIGIEGFVAERSTFGGDIQLLRTDGLTADQQVTGVSLGLFGAVELGATPSLGGAHLGWRVDYTSRTYGNGNNDSGLIRATDVRGSISTDTRVPLGTSFAITGRIRADFHSTRNLALPESELIPVGGAATLRGYADQQFLAVNAATVQLEPTFLIGGSDLYLFSDLGYLDLPHADLQPRQPAESKGRFEYSYGLGVRLRDPRRKIDIGLGWPRGGTLGEPRLFVEFAESL